MNRVIINRRITKPMAVAIMLIALALICGILFTSVSVAPALAATYPMTTPSNGWGDSHQFTIASMSDKSTQSSMSTLSGATSQSISNFSISCGTLDADYNASTAPAFSTTANSWTWSSNASVTMSVAFMYTFKITEELFEGLKDGSYRISLSGSAQGSSMSSSDWYNYLYVGIGYASSDSDAKLIGGFNQVKGYIGSMSSKITSAGSVTPSAISNYDFSNSSSSITSTQNKYLRVGMYARPWVGNGGTMTLTLNSVSLSISAAPASMSMPTDYNTDNGLTWTQTEMIEYVTQPVSSVKTISSLDYSDTASVFTGIDNTTKYVSSSTGKFISNDSWNYPSAPGSPTTLYHIGFMNTYRLTDSVYNSLLNNGASLSLRMSANISCGTTTPDARLWLYAGIGTAGSDSSAVTYNGFKQVQSRYNSHIYYDESDNFSGLGLDTYFQTSSSNTGYKYLRIAFLTELWPGNSTIDLDLSSVRITLKMEEKAMVDSTIPTRTNNMTKPSGWSNYSSTFYDSAVSSNFHTQDSMYTINNSGSTLSTSGGSSSYFQTSGSGIVQNGWGTSGISSGLIVAGLSSVDQEHNTSTSNTYSATCPAYGKLLCGMFYTFKLTENIYNALLAGQIAIDLTPTGGGSGLGDSTFNFYTYSYVGIGYAANDTAAQQGNGFIEIKGYVGPERNHKASGNSASQNTINGFKFTQSGVNSQNYTGQASNGNTKYLRIGAWAYAHATASQCSFTWSGNNFNISIYPVDTSSSGPSYSVSNGAVVSGNQVTISDNPGVDYYTLNGNKVQVAKISNTSFSTNTTVTLPEYGTYTLSAVDLWGNASSSITFTYFYANIIATAETDGVENNYTGGKIVFNANYSNGSGYQSQQVTNSGGYTSNFNIWAKPNEGYYFAGFTLGDHYSSINLNLSSSNTISAAGSRTGNNGNYASIKADSCEFMFSWNVYTNVIIPADGKIYITAHFKAIPTTNNSGTYDKTAKTLAVGSVSNTPGAGTMNNVVNYSGTASTGTAPVNAGVYPATATVTWNGIGVGSKTENINISQKNITATYNTSVSSTYYFGSTDVTSLVGYTFGASDICSGDTVGATLTATLSDKNYGSRNVSVSATLNGAESGNYNLTNPTATLTMAIDKAPVNVIFTTTDKTYDGNNTATVNEPTITGIISGESISFDLTATYFDKNAGENKVVTLTNANATAGANTDLNNYAITTNADNLTATIGKATLTINYDLTTEKIYDGNNVALVENVSVANYILDDNLRLVASVTATYTDVNVSESATINVVVVLDGDEKDNYSYTQASSVAGKIKVRELTITANSLSKTYGEVDPALTYSVSAPGFVNAEDETNANITLSRANGETYKDGGYVITLSCVKPSNNYYLNVANGVFTIEKRATTITLTDGQGSIYGDTIVIDDSLYTATNVVGSDDLGVIITKADGVEVGSYVLSGTASNVNYSYTFVNSVYEIVKRDLTINLHEQGSVYGDAVVVVNDAFTTINLVSGDVVALVITKADGANATAYALSGALDTESEHYAKINANYNVTINGNNYVISARPVDIVLNAQGSEYGDAIVVNSEAYTATNVVGGDDLGVTITKADGETAGEYALTYTWSNLNYALSGDNGVYTIYKATLIASYKSETITYGETPVGEVVYLGWKNGEDVSVLATLASVNFSSLDKTGSYITAGSYVVSPVGATAQNYAFDYVDGCLTVEKANLSVAYNEQITYGQTPVTDVTASEFAVSGLLDGDSVSVLTVVANLPVVAGSHLVSDVNFTFNATNYAVTSISGTLLIDKAPLEIVITAPAGKYYGEEVSLSVSYGTALKPFVNGENEENLTSLVVVDLSAITNANGYVNAGSYDLVETGVVTKATSSNYDITHTVDTLTISKKTLTIVYEGESKIYDGNLPDPDENKVSVTGLVDGEDYEYLKSELGFTFNLTASSASKDVGEYSVYASGIQTLDNYNTYFNSYAFGVYAIAKATLTASYESETIIFGNAPVGSVVLDGFIAGDDESAVTLIPTADFTTITNLTIIGENAYISASETPYEVSVIGGESKNYDFSYVSGYLTVNRKDATITVKAGQGSVYGETIVVNQGASYYEVEGLLDGDAISVTLQKSGDEKVGAHVLTATYVAHNYNVTVIDSEYVITKATLVVTIAYNSASVLDVDVVNLTQADFTITYAGFKYDDSSVETPVTIDLVALIAILQTEVGEYDILYTLGEDAQYDFDYSGVGKIIVVASLKDVDFSGLSFENLTVEYDGNAHSIEVVGSVLPAEVDVQITYEYTKAGRINAGVYGVTATIKVLTAGYKDNIPQMNATLKIEPRKVDVKLLPQGSLYGEEIVVDQSKYEVTSANVLPSDNLVATISKSDVMNANHGEYDLSVTIANANYVLNSVETAVYTISNRNVTITLKDQQGEYGLTAIVTSLPRDYVLSGDALVRESDLSLVINVEYAPVYEVGKAYALNAEVVENEWYNFTVETANYIVKAKAVEIALDNKSVTYGDSVSATTTYSFTNGGLVQESDDLGLTFALTYADKYVVGGNYDITAVASNANYVVTVVKAKYVVEKKGLSIKVADQQSVYGENYTLKNEFEVISGLVDGDSKDDLGVQVKLLNGSTNAGSYILTAEATHGNYEYAITPGTYVINKAETILYLEHYATTFTYSGYAISLGKTAESYVYTNRPDSQANVKYPTDELVDAGSYTVVVSINESTNYLGASQEVAITIEKAIPVANFNALLSKIYVYNGTEQHIRAEDEEIVAKGDLDEVVLTWSNNTFLNVPANGKLEVSVAFSETSNYVSKTFTQVINVNKAKYDFTGVEHSFSSIEVAFNGSKHSVEVVGLPLGIAVTYSYNGEVQEEPFEFRNAGTYVVQAVYAYDNVNYLEPTELIKSAYVKINRIDITIKVVNQHGYYGDEPIFDPSGVEIIAGGFVAGDDIDLDLELEPKESYPIGVYKLVANTTSSGNYNVTVAAGTYEIIPRPITVTVDDKESQYGDEDLPFTFQVTEGTLIGEDTLKSSLVRQEGKTPGEYVISGSVVNPNYAVTLISGKYTIIPRKITIEVFNQEGTSASMLSKRAYKTFGKILKGDNLNIQVVGEIGSTPGEYPITASYNDNPNYEIVVKPGIFTLMKVAKITVNNPIYSKLYDGVPYVFDVEVSSGATPIFSIGGIFVENAFTEVGVYELDVTAEKIGEFAEPDTYRITFEIRPKELTAENNGIFFLVSAEDGFSASESLLVEHDAGIGLSGGDYTSQVNSAFTVYIVNGEEKVALEEYMQGKEVVVKIKLNEELTAMGAETWFMDNDSNVLHEIATPDENGFIEVQLTAGQHVVFVTPREEAAPILVVAGGMGIIFLCMSFFFLFRKKFIN